MGYRFCTACGTGSYIKNGFDALGKQRYICKYCKKSYSMKNKMKKLPTDVVYRNTYTDAELYCLGYLYADGWVQKNRVGICLKKSDGYIIDLIKETFNLDTKITEIKRKDGREHRQILFRLAYFAEDLLHLGFMPAKTGQEMWLPYMESPHFVRGFMDGDGSVFIIKGGLRTSFVSKSYTYLESLGRYIEILTGIIPKTIYDQGKSGVHMMRYNGKQAVQLCDALYKDSDNLRLERKYNKYIEIKNG